MFSAILHLIKGFISTHIYQVRETIKKKLQYISEGTQPFNHRHKTKITPNREKTMKTYNKGQQQ